MQDRASLTVNASLLGDRHGRRIFIEDVYPSVDAGRFPIKRIADEPIEVWADILRDGHAVLAAALLWRPQISNEWSRVAMLHDGNDRWTATFTPPRPGRYVYAIEAWTDLFGTWRHDFLAKRDAGQDVTLEVEEGRNLLGLLKADDDTQARLVREARRASARHGDGAPLLADALARTATEAIRADLTRSREFALVADRERARTSAWYEIMPRSQSSTRGRHGTFDDCILRLPEIAALGFDVLYLTPIHPIGRINRKGRNNALKAEADDPGSPYAIGSVEGGHEAIHPELGTLEDFRRLVRACAQHGLELALDFAVHCSPDHPWLTQHPEWFKWRPDGSLRAADGAAGQYRDIVTPDFACVNRAELWNAFRDVMLFWIDHGVTIFAIDNHDNAPFSFWEWLIGDIRRRHPEVILFSKTYTRLKLMKGLAKLGFTHFFFNDPAPTEKWELEQYFGELTRFPER